MKTNNEILQIALRQSAIDANCSPDDFMDFENHIAYSVKNPNARKYLELPLACNLISYGNNIVASVEQKYEEIVRAYIDKYPAEHCFETPNMQVLNDAFSKYDMKVCFMAEYFLPDVNMFAEIEMNCCKYKLCILENADFTNLYIPQWSNALCEKRKELDILGVGAYDGEQLIGLAACSADCDSMWQIGIDVLPEYRRQGIASALTSRLACEILKCGKVPFIVVLGQTSNPQEMR